MHAHPHQILSVFLPLLLLAGLSLSLDTPAPAADSFCSGNRLRNGGFEDTGGWIQSTTGQGPKCHMMIGDWEWCRHDGEYCASLGGFEGVTDGVRRSWVLLPPDAHLSYWWIYTSFETPGIYNDTFRLNVEDVDGQPLTSISHTLMEEENFWKQDTLDLSAYDGRWVNLSFWAYNDNYYFSTWGIDSVCLTSSDTTPPYLSFFPQIFHFPAADDLPGLNHPMTTQAPSPTPICE